MADAVRLVSLKPFPSASRLQQMEGIRQADRSIMGQTNCMCICETGRLYKTQADSHLIGRLSQLSQRGSKLRFF